MSVLHATAPAFEPAPPIGERSRPAAETVALLRPHFARLGITRLARQTGLDTIGIPCFSAIRPNAPTLSVNMGKGLDDHAAMASAVMEAVEYAYAETPATPRRRASAVMLLDEGRALFDVSPWLPPGTALDPQQPLDWLAGEDLLTGAAVLAPRDALTLGGAPDLPAISQSTNGLASGNTADEALFHALCELIERDATSLWVFRSDAAVARSALDPASFTDPDLDALVQRIDRAGFRLTLFDQTTDLGLPVILALLSPADRPPTRYFDLAAGCSCHPIAARAAIRATVEAAQTRVSNIAGARDDVDPAEYHQSVSASLQALAAIPPNPPAKPPTGLRPGLDDCSLGTMLDHLTLRLQRAGLTRIAVFPLGGETEGVAVLRLLAHGLEDQATNRHWRPGPRGLRAMLGL